jgi:hypothetical protein
MLATKMMIRKGNSMWKEIHGSKKNLACETFKTLDNPIFMILNLGFLSAFLS